MAEKVLVTGVAGFIGSHLCRALLGKGFFVFGVDSFNNNYDVRIKKENLSAFENDPNFSFVEASLNDLDLSETLADVTHVFHLAAQPGVRQSWHDGFDAYIDANIRATQRLCEAARGKSIKRFVFASSSSVYGDTQQLPMSEGHPTQPLSPYGVTKLAAEALCLLYKANHGLPVVALRFFTVFGPGQRPDMAFHKFITSSLDGKPIEVYGNGQQTRDFTFVGDIVDANLRAMHYGGEESVFNIGGGNRVPLSDAIDIVAGSFPHEVEVIYKDPVKGDVVHTYADISKAKKELGYSPRTGLEEGIAMEIEWIRALRKKIADRGEA